MENSIVTGQWQDEFEALIQGMINRGFGYSDDFLDEATTAGLRRVLLKNKKEGKMQPAGFGRKLDFQQNTLVRGDMIKWIEKDSRNKYERALLEKIEGLVHYLNQTCYAGINDYEFHYARYEKNTFYKRHLDQFKSNKGRKYSLVIYLNEDWKPINGGRLSIFLPDNSVESISPIAGRAVFFKSDEIEHEVGPSLNRCRLSIAGWLKSM